MQEKRTNAEFKPSVDKKTNGDVYTNLDSILDTRLSTVYNFDKSSYIDIMGDVDKIEKYLSRRTDSFGRLNSKIFKAIYAKRNKETIRVPLPNRIPLLIHSYIASTIETSFKVPKIYLNVYPYDLAVNEKAVLSNSLKSIYKHKIDIEILYKPEKDITVKFIHEKIGMMFMYNGLKWIEYHMSNKSLLSLNLPDVVMLAPRVMDNNIFTNEQIDNIFKDQEKSMHPFIHLTFITPRAFSLRIDTDKLKNK